MYVCCKDILKLPILEKAKLVAGEQGLNRLISWVHVIEVPNVGDWVNSGELIFLTGIGLKNYQDELIKIVTDMSKKKAAGLFIEIGPYIKAVPQEVKDIANAVHIPLFEIPFEVKVIDITQSICKMIFYNMAKEKSMNELMKEILYGEVNDDIFERAVFYGYDPEKDYKAIVININNFAGYIEKENIKDENIIIKLKAAVENVIKDVCRRHCRKLLHISKSDSFTVMIPLTDKSNRDLEIRNIAEEIRKNIAQTIMGLTVNIGIGRCCRELKDFKKSVCEAHKSLKILKACKRSNSTREYKELGVYRLLFKVDDIEELRNICEEVLGPLMAQDKKNGTELLNNLEIYLREHGNLGKAAEVLYVHRNTMKYRITRIQEILQCDLEDANTCFNLSLAYKIKRFINLV